MEAVARTGAQQQLDNLISGNALNSSDIPVQALRAPSERLIDRYMARRAIAESYNARTLQAQTLMDGYQASLQKLSDLKDLQFVMDFSGGQTLAAQTEVAVQALSMGVSRTATLTAGETGIHTETTTPSGATWETPFAG